MKKFLGYLIFWLLSLTWGLLMTTIGLIVVLVMLITLHKPQFFGPNIRFELKKASGFGVNFGPVFIVGHNDLDLSYHEAGHGVQNVALGPLFIILVAIPSFVRYWYREMIYKKDPERYYKLPDYDSIWFENTATKLGEYFYN